VLVCASCGFTAEASFRFCPECAAPLAGENREQRKTVTVLFCDVTGSTALGESTDPEALRALLARYFERMKAIVESHGGTVEKFIGDAVMAVFGVPQAHEDDALRASRAAVEMRDALPELGIRGRIGVNTGEVVTGTAERLATGDAVNVAARFEQAAEPGEVLIGEATHALVREAVVTEPVEPLVLKGKAEPVPAFRLVSVLDAPERSHASRFVGREQELARIVEAWDRAEAQATCELVTVIGDAGVGKSRLVAEALAAVEPRVVRGRCLPYGEGTSYWPVVEVLKQLAALLRSDRGRGDSIPARRVGGRDERRRNRLGVPKAARGAGTAGRRPRRHRVGRRDLPRPRGVHRAALVRCAVAASVHGPAGVGRAPARLARDTSASAAELGRCRCADRRRRTRRTPRADRTCRGRQPAVHLRDAGHGRRQRGRRRSSHTEGAPRSQARPARRGRAPERGSVEGEIFHRGSVQALTPDETQVTSRLAALARHQLVRPDRAQLAGDDGYRFRHLLIRDAAYEALPKGVRAELHARFADWLDEHGQALVERDEIVGYHLEQAARYHTELGDPTPELADRAANRLVAAGQRAIDREDPAGEVLLTRAAELVRPHRLDLALELESAYAPGSGRDLPARAQTAEAAAERAEAAADHSGALLGRALALLLRSVTGEPDAIDDVIELCRAALPFEEERADPRRLSLLWELRASAANFHQQHGDAVEASLQPFRYQGLAGYSRSGAEVEFAVIVGPQPVVEAMGLIDELAPRPSRPPGSQDLPRAALLAMLGRFDEAWPLAEARACHLREVTGHSSRDACLYLAMISTIEGDRERACRHNADEIELIANMAIPAATAKARLARDLCHLGRFDEAEVFLEEARTVPPPGSGVRVMAASAEALLLAHRGEFERADALARLAVTTAETRTDNLWWHASTHEDLAVVLERAGRIDEAREELERALAVWKRKGCLPEAQRIRDRIASLGPTAP
jgi:class 3 adenylate cyclase/tetratricopeptide (TPR) repeat protein